MLEYHELWQAQAQYYTKSGVHYRKLHTYFYEIAVLWFCTN